MKIDLGDEGLKLIGRRAPLRLYAGNTAVRLMAATVLLAMVGCGLCSDEVKVERASPDGSLKATWFVRNCGATTDFSTVVSIHRPDISYKDNDSVVFVARGSGPLLIVWDDARHLRIDCAGCQRKDIFRELTALGDVDISY